MGSGVRYWSLESYMGGFIGMYGTVGTYSVGNCPATSNRYEGKATTGLASKACGAEPRMGSRCGCRKGWLMTNIPVNAGDLVGQEWLAFLSDRAN